MGWRSKLGPRTLKHNDDLLTTETIRHAGVNYKITIATRLRRGLPDQTYSVTCDCGAIDVINNFPTLELARSFSTRHLLHHGLGVGPDYRKKKEATVAIPVTELEELRAELSVLRAAIAKTTQDDLSQEPS